MSSLIEYLTHIKGMLHKFNNRFCKDDHTLSKSATCIEYVQTMLDCLRIQRCIFFNLLYFSRGELPTPKGVIPKIWFVVLEEYHIMMHSEKNVCICEGHILRAYIYHVFFFFFKHILKRALRVKEGSFLTQK